MAGMVELVAQSSGLALSEGRGNMAYYQNIFTQFRCAVRVRTWAYVCAGLNEAARVCSFHLFGASAMHRSARSIWAILASLRWYAVSLRSRSSVSTWQPR